jgi:GPH family glycoside/pentoside/hexuronide:cation symporter
MTTASPRLPVTTKLAYGVGDLGAAIVAGVVGFYLNVFLLDVARLRPGLVGIIFLVATLWDAVTDPIVGNMSDRTQSKMGRRRPWLLYASVPFGLTFFLHWLVPNFGTAGLFAYYLVMSLLLKTAFTAVNVPYTALTAELTPDYDERTRLTAYRFSFSIFGALTSVALFPVIIDAFGENVLLGYTVSAAVWAVFIAASGIITAVFTREPKVEPVSKDDQLSIIQGLRVTMGNRPFLYVTGIYLLSWLTIQFVQANLLLYVRYWLDAEDVFTIYIVILQLTAFAFLGFWSWFSGKYGKKWAYSAGAGLWALVMFGFFLMPQGVAWPMYILIFFAGIGVSVAYLLPWSMLPDVVEYDELQTGQRREGVYYGLFVFLQKLGLSLGLALSNFILEAAGYINPDVAGEAVAQPDSVLFVLRLFVSFIPAFLLLLSLPIAVSYPITPAKFAEIREQLASKS